MPTFLLGLSGGGFRATIFHLGVLRAFRTNGLLTDIDAISAVSGGTITAAYLVLRWHEYADYAVNHLPTIEGKLHDFVTKGIRDRITLRWPKALFTGKTSTDLLVAEYRRLFDSATLPNLVSHARVPKLYMMTTNLSRHSAYSYFSDSGYTYDQRTISITDIYLAEAVAASSAFPLMFPALVLDYVKRNATESAGASRDFLADGGVFENLGLTVLRDHATAKQLNVGSGCVIVLSNAGKNIDWDLETNFSRKLFGNLNRSLDVMQFWAEQRLLASLTPGHEVIGISSSIKPTGARMSIPPEIVQKAAAYVRTDFDRFSEFEYRFLYDHGFALADQLIKSNPAWLQNRQPPATDSYQPWSDDIVRLSREPKRVQTLQRPVRVLPRPSTFRDVAAIPYALLLAALCFGIWQSIPWISRVSSAAGSWLNEQRFSNHPSNGPKFLEPQTSANVADHLSLTTHDLSREASAAIDSARRRYIQTMAAKIVVVVEQEKPFDADYQSLHRWTHFGGEGGAGNVRAAYGSAFLVNTDVLCEGPRYREVRLPRAVNGEIEGCIEVVRPKKGESLVLVLVVVARNAEEPMTAKDVENSSFSLEVSK